MLEMSITLPPSEMNKLNSLIREMQKTTGAEMKKVVRNTGRDFCASASRITPMAPKNAKRWMRIIPGGDKSKAFWKLIGRGTNLFISQSKFNAFSKDGRRKNYGSLRGRFVQTKQGFNRGMMKSGWITCLHKLGVENNVTVRKDSSNQVVGLKVNPNYGEVFWYESDGKVALRIVNKAPAIGRVDKGAYPGGKPRHIVNRALQDVIKRTDKRLNKMAARTINKAVGARIAS